MGVLQKCITSDGLVTAVMLDSTDIVKKAASIHNCTPIAASALGRLLTGASIMGEKLKEAEASMTMRIGGGGPLGFVIAVSDSSGNVRGYCENPSLAAYPDASGQLCVPAAIGSDGDLLVIKDFGSGQPYTARCPLVSGGIAEDLAGYYANSEQIPTIFIIGVRTDDELNITHAGGLLIQLLPAADEREIVKLEHSLKSLPPLTTMMSEGLSREDILKKALLGFEVEFFDEQKVFYRCNCSRDRVTRALLTLPRDQLLTLAEEDGQAHIECHFCDKRYDFTRDQLVSLADQSRNP